MQSRSSLLLRVCGRLCFGLVLLASLALGVSARPAHAQSPLTVSDCSSDSQLQTDVGTANMDNHGDTITFSCSGDIKLSKTLTISGNMTIDGSGQSVTLDGQQQFGVFLVNGGANLTLNALTISNGVGTFDSGFQIVLGGGIYDAGGTVSISNSTVNHNSVSGGGADGGGIANANGTLTVTNSTVSNNSASNVGGGIVNINSGTMTVANSTVSNNSSGNAGGGIGNLNTSGMVTIRGSIIANNTGGDCGFGSPNDQGYNLSSDSSCGFTGNSVQNTNPMLGPLASNGGPTQTMALQQGSPAIDAGPPAGSCPTTDQRGNARPDNGETACDMGAYEFQDPIDKDLALTNVPANITANATSPQGAVVPYTAPTVVDEDSPLPSVNCSPASGSTFAIGTTQVTCTVTDSDDSNSPVRASFMVMVNGAATQVSNLITTVNSFHLAKGLQASLDTQLQAVQADLSANNTAKACLDLTSFINHVKAQSGKGLTVNQANQLLAAATNIQHVLAC